MSKKVIVVGIGYVGLPAAMMLAKVGYEVVGVDINKNIVDSLNCGELHIDEPEIKALMLEADVRRNLKAKLAPPEGDIFIIAVPTPLHRRKKIADLSYVEAALESIVPKLRKGNLLIIESTIPPLTCREVLMKRVRQGGFEPGRDIMIAHCPERILPGNILHEIKTNDRIIGGIDEASTEAARELYASFVTGDLHLSDDITAELCKLMENTYRDVNIALANEFQAVGETLGVDITKAIRLANKHPRVNILSPGIGVGGHCIPIDPWFIKEVDPENSSLIFASRRINEAMPHKVAARIRRALQDVDSPRIVAVGATYKPDVYDLRESPALEIVEILRADGYDVKLCDPLTSEYPCGPLADETKGFDCLAVLVPHQSVLRDLQDNMETIISGMRTPNVLRF